jgi:DNA-binding transcriptional ArsR family regulator
LPLNVLGYAIIHVCMNDGIIVSMWQDGNVEDLEQPAGVGDDAGPAAPAETRAVADVEILRAMADPTRLAILSVLMERPDDLQVMSVKEIAARIGEPQTKLYRHMKHLEAAGLIRVAATRMVSGILEQRYQAGQRELQFDRSFMRAHADESEIALGALFDGFRARFFAAFTDERFAPENLEEAERFRLPTICFSETRISPARAAEVSKRLREVTELLDDKAAEDPGGVAVNVLIGYYTGTEPEPEPS